MKIRSNNAAFWCKDELTFVRLSKVMVDDGWPTTYSGWLENANKFIAAAQKKGLIVTKIEADPDEFSSWCRVNSRPADGGSRIRYAVEKFSEIPKTNN